MARILDVLHPPERRERDEPAAVKSVSMLAPAADSELDDDNGVPFVEVGGPVMKGQFKSTRNSPPSPTIIPLPRAAEAPKPRIAETEELALFRLSFQPLPFPDRADGPPSGRFARELVAFHQPDHEISEQYGRLLSD